MKYISLGGKYRGVLSALVDDEDYEPLSHMSWSATGKRGYTMYAHAAIRVGDVWKYVYMHRIVMGNPSGMIVDHINGNGLDNRRANLRITNHAGNQKNVSKKSPSSAGYKGVIRRGERFRGIIVSNGKRYYLGTYDSAVDAALAYDAAALELHGKYASLNFG